MKKAFTLVEILFVISIISIILSFFYLKQNHSKLDIATNRILIYLKEVRYQSLIDNKKEQNNPLWHKKRWTLKFFRCRKDVGGIYYSIYSDRNMTGHPSLEESLKDPLTNKRIYSNNKCVQNENSSKYVLLTKEFEIEDVQISCNNTKSLGQISFGSDGKVYSKLSSYENENFEYEIKDRCIIRLKSRDKGYREIIIESITGYTYIKE